MQSVQNNNDIDVNLKGTIDITEKYGIQRIRAVLMIGSASGQESSRIATRKQRKVLFTTEHKLPRDSCKYTHVIGGSCL